jgi:hypothetical protein
MRGVLAAVLVVCGLAAVAVGVVALFGWPWAALAGGAGVTVVGLYVDDGKGKAPVIRR